MDITITFFDATGSAIHTHYISSFWERLDSIGTFVADVRHDYPTAVRVLVDIAL